MTPPQELLEEAARYAAVSPPAEPFSPGVSGVMVATLLEQRARLVRALLEAYPAFVQPAHQRPPQAARALW